jgi:hypothetical protein
MADQKRRNIISREGMDGITKAEFDERNPVPNR